MQTNKSDIKPGIVKNDFFEQITNNASPKIKTKKYEIGYAVLPRTYLSERGKSWLINIIAFFRGLKQLVHRAYMVKAINSRKIGFASMITAGYTGHTMLHSHALITANHELVQQKTIGYTPDGFVNKMRIAVGEVKLVRRIVLLACGLTSAVLFTTTAKNLISCLASGWIMGIGLVKLVGTSTVPAKFHDETEINNDPASVALMFEVGLGIYTNFVRLQKVLTACQSSNYAFIPNLQSTHNCGSLVVAEMRSFINQTKNHNAMLGELQSGFEPLEPEFSGFNRLAKFKSNENKPIYSPNQLQELQTINQLDKITIAMEAIIDRNLQSEKHSQRGNQSDLTKFLTDIGATHSKFKINSQGFNVSESFSLD